MATTWRPAAQAPPGRAPRGGAALGRAPLSQAPPWSGLSRFVDPRFPLRPAALLASSPWLWYQFSLRLSLRLWYQLFRHASYQITRPRVEWVAALCLSIAIGWGIDQAWQFYDANLLAGPAPSAALPPQSPRAARADDPAEVRRWQAVLDHLGEASTYRAAKRPEWARAALQRVLELDPGNREATAMLQLMELEPAPALPPEDGAARQGEARVVELLGAASSFLAARQAGAARPLLEEVLALDPTNRTAHEMLGGLSLRP